jgi:hypothetical protein
LPARFRQGFFALAGGQMRIPRSPQGDRARGISAERFEIPLAGGAAASMRASVFGWRAACDRRGGNHPRPGFPHRGNGKGGSTSLLPQAICIRLQSFIVVVMLGAVEQ